MKKLSKLVLHEHISPADFVSKKAQKYILGGSGGGSDGAEDCPKGTFPCTCVKNGEECHAGCHSKESDCELACKDGSGYCD